MKRIHFLCAIILSSFIRHCQNSSSIPLNIDATTMFDTFENKNIAEDKFSINKPVWSTWGKWSPCFDGRRTRRKHCVFKEACSGSLRLEVSRCRESAASKYRQAKESETGRARSIVEMPSRKQIRQIKDVQKIFVGFSPWSPWSSCSRRCTTVRRRYCRRPAICGKKVVRQSAYCYLEGSFCHNWIRHRMQRRKDPGYTIVESLPKPAPVIHAEDSSLTVDPPCGILGRYRGTAAEQRRARMWDMLKIIGGRPAPPGKWPWQVALLNRFKEAFCGGTLVSLRWVVTAAHCVRNRLYVRLGEHDLLVKGYGEVELRVTEAVVHPHYDPDTVVNDVALLRLPKPAKPELGHGLACLPQPAESLAPYTPCVILGWGKRRNTDVHGTRVLHEAQVSIIKQGVCRRSYWQYAITDSMVCAGRGRCDSCAGDSGGPLLCRHDNRYYLQGITSFGEGCGKRGKYGIYTRAASYVPWMNRVMMDKYFD